MRILALATTALLGLTAILAVAMPASAGPLTCSNTPKALGATCGTVNVAYNFGVGEANCFLNTAPVNWVATCGGPFSIPVPLIPYVLCYPNTAPVNWVANCL